MPEESPPAQKFPLPSATAERIVLPENCVVVAFTVKVPSARTEPTARGTGDAPVVLEESIAVAEDPAGTLYPSTTTLWPSADKVQRAVIR